ncbi:FAD-dependent monooxygenase [Agrobacterium larrymoorei]|uniref:FAD-binding monooxygenase n=1 Tax=Agrobacterium larrymoorei TaxID=160699 RepID=A0A4D7DYJ8_9HYPH|nr:FAD-dependent monooxygenase [Agrobacterium larrymoorei]QCI99246.1 FAD-binding monooxygenase [Agrobacterium larrymoorei]QYA08781.1 FAD-dependent monooxygenase [Agrobacterium larrymoorei]
MAARVLITGASIAGNTTAWWLGRFAYDVTVVEKAPQFRDGGQNVDIRGVGREVLQKMNLEQTALDHGTGEIGTAWVDEEGKTVAEFITDDLDQDGPTAEMEILRGDLARLIYNSAREKATFRFGDSVAGIDDTDKAVIVTFSSGATEEYDIVIVAEGVGSSTRDLIFLDENNPRWMDLTIAYFTIPREAEDDQRWRWYNTTEGRSISLRPDMVGTTRCMLSVQQPPSGEHEWSVEKQKTFLRERFRDAGWQADRVLKGLQRAEDFYFDVLRQVRMPNWSRGRVVLTGDAAWCATPIAGIGATLAVTGAYVLANELHRHSDTPTALEAYERAMRPMVEKGQGVPKIAPRMMNPHSKLGITLLHGALNLASKPGVNKIASKLLAGEQKAPDLSVYDTESS